LEEWVEAGADVESHRPSREPAETTQASAKRDQKQRGKANCSRNAENGKPLPRSQNQREGRGVPQKQERQNRATAKACGQPATAQPLEVDEHCRVIEAHRLVPEQDRTILRLMDIREVVPRITREEEEPGEDMAGGCSRRGVKLDCSDH
jgi:tRNA(Ser,Leu) C12 N-acetylase TAN1